jgi:hypothetical protein
MHTPRECTDSFKIHLEKIVLSQKSQDVVRSSYLVTREPQETLRVDPSDDLNLPETIGQM